MNALVTTVLILVLVDDGLWLRNTITSRCTTNLVLILVLVDDGLWLYAEDLNEFVVFLS